MKYDRRVLIVEDDLSWQDLYKEILTDAGYKVETTSNLATSLDALDRVFFHVAIVDLRLSEKDESNRDGLDVLDRIWKLDEGTAAIVASGYLEVSMFDEFRTYGIFDLAEKPPTLRPDEAIKELKTLTFIKGEIDKSAPADIVRAVDRAIPEVQRRGIQEIWTTSPFSFIHGLSAKKVQRTLGGGQMVELRPFLGNLCRPFMPWLQAKEKPVEIKVDDRCVGFQTPCWSRALGKAIAIRFGRRNSFEQALGLIPVDSVNRFGEIQQGKLKHITYSHFEGAVYALEKVDFKQHFKPPAPKRTVKSGEPTC
jgi:ActR/RegA family two-component response regulator